MLRKNYSDGITATVGVACTICVRVVCFHAGAVVAVVGWSALEIEHGDVCCSDPSLSLLVVTVESKYPTCNKQTTNILRPLPNRWAHLDGWWHTYSRRRCSGLGWSLCWVVWQV